MFCPIAFYLFLSNLFSDLFQPGAGLQRRLFISKLSTFLDVVVSELLVEVHLSIVNGHDHVQLQRGRHQKIGLCDHNRVNVASCGKTTRTNYLNVGLLGKSPSEKLTSG